MDKSLNLIEHPIVQHKLGYLRDRNTTSAEFRQIMGELSSLLAYEATRDLNMHQEDITTPVTQTKVDRISRAPIAVSILRAGDGMLEGILRVLPFASAGHIGIYRDKFIKNTVEYYFKIPANAKGRDILLLDPLVATADTMISCLDRLKQYDVGRIKILTILISPHGLSRIQHFHPEVEIFVASVEDGITEDGYLTPGIGDAGDRLYHTK
ncbi:MAG: uracil phosphoribosyltransferase [Pseudobacteriovorax sp.]|nr:uracil phosphoribosyltransferase [Pseudobacteriovorax sp.]